MRNERLVLSKQDQQVIANFLDAFTGEEFPIMLSYDDHLYKPNATKQEVRAIEWGAGMAVQRMNEWLEYAITPEQKETKL